MPPLTPPLLSLLLLSLLALLPSTLALPTPQTSAPTPLSSSHNIYLSTCDPTTTSPRRTALLLYTSGGPSTSSPALLATVSATGAHWEGTRRTADLGDAGSFASDIALGAEELRKGEVAGEAELAGERFVCFRDGVSVFVFSGGERCVGEYWCGAV